MYVIDTKLKQSFSLSDCVATPHSRLGLSANAAPHLFCCSAVQ
jgi:hypothetical protein